MTELNNELHLKKILLYTAFFVWRLSPLSAQSVLFFSVGSTDAFSNGNTVSCLPFQINANNNCLEVDTGLSLYFGEIGNSPFVMNCSNGGSIVSPKITLYPNPVVDYATIISDSQLNTSVSLQLSIVDATGRAVLRQTINSNSLNTGLRLYLGQLSAGNYFLKLEGGAIRCVISFLKLK